MVSWAEEAPQSEAVGELPTYVVVSTRTPLSMDRVSPSVSYISEEEMAFWQDRSLIDSLGRIPGVAFWSSGSPGSLTSLSIRGSESNHTSFFLDGRRLNPGVGNQFDLESLSSHNLSSVQVQSGASSVNYGASGIGGSVALQSQDTLSADGFSGNVRAELGSNDYRSGSVKALYADEDWGLSLGATALSTDNERTNDDFERETAQLRFDYKLVENLAFELVGQYTDAEKGTPGVVTNPKSDDRQWTENWLISPGLRYATDAVSVHLFYSRSKSRIENDTEDRFGDIIETKNEVESDEVNLQVDYTVSNQSLLTLGAVYRNDEASNPNLNAFSASEPVEPYENNFEQTGLWGQFQWQFLDSFEIRTGLRYDSYSDFDNSWDGSLELIYYISENSSLFFKLATSYAPPSALDVASDDNQMLVDDGMGGQIIIPNQTPLNPEESTSYEIGYKQKLLDSKLDLAVVIFRNEIDELIAYDSFLDSSFNFGSDTFNVEKATTEGVELSVDYAASQKLNFGLGYTYLTATNDSEEQRLANRPRHQVQLSATYRPVESLSVGLSGVGHFDRERGRFLQSNLDMEDYFVVDMAAEWAVNGQWDLFGRVGNLLDEEYARQFGYPALGRAGYIGARFNF